VILVRYDFNDVSYTGPSATDIEMVEVELVVANDYLIEMSSNRQLDANGRQAFLPAFEAKGNVKDGSNQRVLTVDYGMPTANQIAGMTVEVSDLHGFRCYGELDVNHQYRQYPNPGLREHHVASTEAQAWFFNLSRQMYPLFAFGEAFRIEPEYSTSFVTADEDGVLDYGDDFQLFEMVDDNDDQDRRPDWRRQGWTPGDDEVFPG
jgi:hypothetical protein